MSDRPYRPTPYDEIERLTAQLAETARIVRDIALKDPYDATYGFCTLCESGVHGAQWHGASCPYTRAVAWARAHPEPLVDVLREEETD